MKQESKKIIKNLGYRPLKENALIFAKPIGYSCILIDLREKIVIKQIYKGDGDEKMHIWYSMDVNEEELLKDIIDFERYQMANNLSEKFCNFSFGTKQEEIDDLLKI
jgi:hypothetical protein